MKMRQQYKLNKEAALLDRCTCPSCGNEFTKTNYQQAFCKTRPGTKCKDKYWNTVTPTKRNNKTRISPASQRWLNSRQDREFEEFDPHDTEHPCSSEALGQW